MFNVQREKQFKIQKESEVIARTLSAMGPAKGGIEWDAAIQKAIQNSRFKIQKGAIRLLLFPIFSIPFTCRVVVTEIGDEDGSL